MIRFKTMAAVAALCVGLSPAAGLAQSNLEKLGQFKVTGTKGAYGHRPECTGS